jgi:hypothetical protein
LPFSSDLQTQQPSCLLCFPFGCPVGVFQILHIKFNTPPNKHPIFLPRLASPPGLFQLSKWQIPNSRCSGHKSQPVRKPSWLDLQNTVTHHIMTLVNRGSIWWCTPYRAGE